MVPRRAEAGSRAGEAGEHRERTLDAAEHRRTMDVTEDPDLEPASYQPG